MSGPAGAGTTRAQVTPAVARAWLGEPVQATITAGDVSGELRVVRLGGGRLAGAVPPSLAPLLADGEQVEVDLALTEPDGTREELPARAAIVRSGRTWTEARGRLRAERGWARRLVRSPVEIVVLTPAPQG